jgi:protein O-GlcNAc transferase
MEPFFKENDIVLFNKYLDNASVYFEFGSGGSTYQAFIKNNVKKIYSVESDFDWHNKLKLIIGNTDKINFIFNEMDVRSNSWGHPGPNCSREQKIDYSSHIEYLSKEEKKAIDLILIDGRFRVACCLKCFNEINNECFIIFDDFLNREEYHVVLDYYFIVEKTEDETMVV